MTAKVEADNAKEEIQEILEKCTKCGMCKSLCPVFKIIREETISPRGKVMILQEKLYDKIIYECSLCKACEERCALNIKLCEAFRKARKVLVETGHETRENKEMIKNIREEGNPFGKLDSRKPGKLYCC